MSATSLNRAYTVTPRDRIRPVLMEGPSDCLQTWRLSVQVGACHVAGGRWQVPTASSAKAREGADAAGQPCSVWDLSVHPAACQQALASARHKVGWPAGYDCAR